LLNCGTAMLSLHHLTALDLTAAELVAAAAELQCDAVCLFTHLASHQAHRFPCISSEKEANEVANLARDLGVGVCDLEVFSIGEDFDLSSMRPGLERGAILGATRATVHIRDIDDHRASSHFAQFCELANTMAIMPAIEFTGFSVTKTIQSAAHILRTSGATHAGVVADALHLFRNGMALNDLAAHSSLVTYAQLCDGLLNPSEADYYSEAVSNRMVPGDGEFPLRDFVRLLPVDTPIAVEVPLHRLRDEGQSAFMRAKQAVTGARNVLRLARLEPLPNA
jgi:sugar phosphate isomerase/epimerase